MNFLKSLGGFVGSSAATGGLPYALDDADGAAAELPDFHVLSGRSKADAAQLVTVFKSKQPAAQPTQNALKRIKTLRHPNILAFLDGVEVANNGPVIIVTEQVVPLPTYLEQLRRQYGAQSDEFQMSVAWGLRSVLLALQFINVDCKMLHGRLNPWSVFVTKGGDWKLGGFELTGELTSDGPSYTYTSFEQFADGSYKAPECQRREWKTMGLAPTYSADMWAFACLAYYVFNDSQLRTNDLASASNIPHALRMQYRKAVEADPRRRPSPDKVLASSYFDTPFIKRMDFLENLAVKTPEEKVEFYKDLGANLATLPQAFGVHKVLPALKGVVDFGAATAGKNGPVKLDPSASHMLPAMVQIGSSLSAEEFKDQVLPTIVKLFTCNDRAVRVQLLQMMEKFAVHLDAKLINSAVVFDNLCSGFTDAAPILRELTVKSMLHIADKLSDSNLNTRVMKYFAKLQTDPEPAIRTNTTICLGRIAEKLNESTRPKVLFPAFSRALRDPFPHARLAGLRSMTACEQYFAPQAAAASVIPAIAPLLLDVSVSVREQASISMNLFMKKVTDEAIEMKRREDEQAREQQLRKDTEAEAHAPPASGADASVSSSGGLANSLGSWAASTVASNVGKIVGSGSTPPPSAASAPSFASQRSTPSNTGMRLTSTPSAFPSAPAPAASSAFAVDDDDFGTDDDAWNDDAFDALDRPAQASFSSVSTKPSSSSFSPAKTASSSSSMKLSTTRAAPTSSSLSIGAVDNGGWGDDNWGADDLFASQSPAAPKTTPSKLSSQASASSARTSSFGTAVASSTTGFSSQAAASSSGSGLSASSAVAGRKSVSERLADVKAKRASGGAMKLESTKKGDEWDNWDF
ncbi:hypothetical protein P43SY_001968 [Pythium insidiosum]|uniref:Protein kinase domain-containing protein n=1 Tax=Pythium insidiosum TaxID=114742 RepID=A0AAD5QAC1_PYTIN|nr:hypothetical protein P43SY_001968 [Pythium insidiosum]